MAIESAVVVAELADMAWTKYSKNLEAKTEAKFVEKEVAAAETALAREQLENKRLRAVLEEYKGALLDLQNRVSATDWLRVELSSDEGTLDVCHHFVVFLRLKVIVIVLTFVFFCQIALQIFDQVQKRVDSPEFLALIDLPPEVRSRLTSSLETRYTDKGQNRVVARVSFVSNIRIYSLAYQKILNPSTICLILKPKKLFLSDGLEINVNVADASWWSWVNEEDFERPREERDPLDGTGYVLVDSDDVIDAVANFVARFLAAHPETQVRFRHVATSI